MRRFEINGYAVVSADLRIADSVGRFPASLRFDADQEYFQKALSEATLTLLGRLTHEAAPNTRNRRRLVLSRSLDGSFCKDGSTTLCNPATVDLGEVLESLVEEGGRVAIAGGTEVYDLIADTLGFDSFHLSVAEHCRIGPGKPLFSDCTTVEEAGRKLVSTGLELASDEWLDREAGLRLLVYSRPGLARRAAFDADHPIDAVDLDGLRSAIGPYH